MDVGSRTIGPQEPAYFIAEAGVNHNGDLSMAKELVDAAEEAGADAVKFQTFRADELVTESAAKAAYQEERTASDSHYEMLKSVELDRREFREIQRYCESTGITFLSTPFDRESADFLDELGVPAIKLGSGELDNHPFLEYVATLGRPLIVSTGMGTMAEVRGAFEVIRSASETVPLAFLHCTSAYPVPVDEVNLRAMQTMREELPVTVGYSDHTLAVEMPGLAVAAGATIVEKHFTLDDSLPGPDHAASLEPDELARAVEIARMAGDARGTATKRPVPAEKATIDVARKSVHADGDVTEGEVLTRENTTVCRPANGLSPTEYDSLLGRAVTRNLENGDPITEDAVDWGTDRE